MKYGLIILLFELYNTVCLFSQDILKEFIVEKTENSSRFYKDAGCTPYDGVLVFYTTIPGLEFSMPNTPSRLISVSDYDTKSNCYVLCVKPTEKGVLGSQYTQYSIKITAQGYKPEEAFRVSDLEVGKAQHFKINPKMNNYENTASVSEVAVPVKDTIPTPTTIYSAMEWFQEGRENSKGGNYLDAIQCYRNALDKNPNMSDTWYYLGIAYGKEKKESEALECYKKAAQLGNKDAQKFLMLIGVKYKL